MGLCACNRTLRCLIVPKLCIRREDWRWRTAMVKTTGKVIVAHIASIVTVSHSGMDKHKQTVFSQNEKCKLLYKTLYHFGREIARSDSGKCLFNIINCFSLLKFHISFAITHWDMLSLTPMIAIIISSYQLAFSSYVQHLLNTIIR